MKPHDSANSRALEIVRGLLGGAPDIGALLGELYNLIWEGADPNALRVLLESGQEELEVGAAWIMSEMGLQCQPLLDWSLPLAEHKSKRIRAYAVDFIVNQRGALTVEARNAARLLSSDADIDVRAYAKERFDKLDDF